MKNTNVKNNIYKKEDICEYISRHGSIMKCFGNIAPEGAYIAVDTVKEDMIGMRGVVRRIDDIKEVIKTAEANGFKEGDAIFCLGKTKIAKEDCLALSEALKNNEAKHLLFVFSFRPEVLIENAVNAWYESYKSAVRNHAHILKDDDRMEYDLTTELFGVDLIECLDHRLSEKAAEPFYFEKLEDDVWIIGEEFTRQFLVLGEEKALLIDAGFGYADLRKAAESITDLPIELALTHGHFDHAGGVKYFDKAYLNEKDYDAITARQGREILEKIVPLEDGHVFDLGGRKIRTIAVRGHSKGSVVFYDENTKTVYAGDSLLCGPFFLLFGEQEIRSLIGGLKSLLDGPFPIERFYPAHRSMFPMYRNNVEEIIELLTAVADKTIEGCPTWIGPMVPSPYKTYHMGPYSVYA